MLEPPRDLFEPESEFHLADYVKIFTDRWQLIVLIALLAVAGGVLSYLVTPKEYRATTTILIERRLSIPVQSAIEAAWENYYSMEFYPTQYRLLQSRGLAERTVQNLRLDQDPAFNPARASLAGGGGAGGSAAADQAALAGLAGGLLGGLEVKPVGQTQMVEISYRSTNPELAARIANGVAETYIDWGIENRSNLAGKTSVFLGAQIETLKQEIQDKENQALAYSKRADIVTLDTGGNVVLSRLQALNTDYTSAVSERISKGAALKELEIATPEIAAEILDDPIVVQLRGEVLEMERDYATKLSTFKPEWPAMVELKSRIDQARRNLLPAAREALSKAREAARSEYQGALRREQALSSEINALKVENREVNSASIEYNNLRLEIDTRRQLLDEMLRKQSETDVSSRLQATRESNVRVVDRALVPGGPFRPSLRRNVTLSGGVGLMLGFGLVLLLHYMDRTIKTTEEVERQLGVPVLAVIPDVTSGGKGYGILGRYGYGYGYGYGDGYGYGEERTKSRSRKGKGANGETTKIELLPHLRPRMPVAEAYRALRTALLLSTASELKVVVITSSIPGEGKTSTASNLAIVLAQLGKSVLLLDGDLRKPRLHEVFGMSNRLGLVNHLTGSAGPEQILLRTEVPNLYLTPSGPAPPNPSELLSSERMRDLMRLLRLRFDYVVVDSAPALAVTDATILGSMSDGVVLTACAGRVQRQEAKACRDRLRQAEVKVLGAVLNRFRLGGGAYRKGYAEYQAYVGYGEEKRSGEVAAL